jgi:hypothetical protein
MHEVAHWMLDARTLKVVIAIWFAAVIVYGFWRSRATAPADPIRESGPIL